MSAWPSAIVLAVAAAAGATLAVLHARRAAVPFAAGLAHGGIGLAGTVLLVAAAMRGAQPPAVNAALLLFLLVLVGGGFLLLFRLQREPPPGFMIVLHGGTALVALAVLWVALAVAG